VFFNSEACLLICFGLDDLSISKYGELKSPTIIVQDLFVLLHLEALFHEIMCANIWYVYVYIIISS
jgi:hypothetical protein